MSCTHMQELSQKFEGVETVYPPAVSRLIRRKFPDFTSPLTKSGSRHLFIALRAQASVAQQSEESRLSGKQANVTRGKTGT